MIKILSNKYLAMVNVAFISILVLVFTIDIISVLINTSDYNFHDTDPSYSRRSLRKYLITTIPINIIVYLIAYIGWKSTLSDKSMRLRVIFNLIGLLLIVLMIFGLILWARGGYDH